jgi:hypothetical protein
MDQDVKTYISKQKSPQKKICEILRKIIIKTLPKVEEKIKLGVLWYGKFYIVGLKDSVNLGFAVEGLSKEDMSNFDGKGKMMRHLKFKEVKEIDEKQIVKLLKLVDKKSKCSC